MASVTTSGTQAAARGLAPLPPASGRAGLAGAVRSEFTKIRSVRSTYWTLLVLLVVSIGLGAAISAGAASDLHAHPAHKAGFDATQISLIAFFELGQLVIAVLGALAITAEYSTGMIRTSLAAQPRRGAIFAAKAIVFTCITLAVTIVTSFTAFFLGQAVLSGTGVSASLSGPGVARAVIGTALFVTLVGLFAFALGVIIRHTAGTITAAIGVMFVIPILVRFLPDTWRWDIMRWMPDAAGRVISVTVGGSSPHLFSAWPQFAVTAAYTAALLAAGAVVLRKRDA